MSQGDQKRPPGEPSDGQRTQPAEDGGGQTTALPRPPPDEPGAGKEPTGATTALPRQDAPPADEEDTGATTAIPRHAAGEADPQATTALPGGSSADAAMDVRATAASSPAAAVSFGASSRAHRPGAAFTPDEIVSERFKIIGFIAAGGMGEVYEVEDIELKKRIALKTIRPEIARDKDSLDRFKREIHLSHQITHPNVCRIFDIFHHTRDKDGERDTITFLTMELLQGQTLADLLRHRGPMTVDEALPLVRQMASALAAAHKVGVVHRDFKTGNVILVPDSSEPSGVRVTVADFGLARSELAADAFYEVSKEEDKMVVGTPAYMAPEQVQAKPITPAADMYALGVVFFEMVTGRLPFMGDNPLETALKRLEEPAPSPRSLAPSLEERWEQVILRLMARDPEARWADGRELVDFLDDIDKEAERRRLKRRFILPAIALTTLALGAGLLLSRLFAPSHDSVAVLGFKNLSGRPEADWMSTALSEMLVAEMAVGGEMQVVPTETVARVKKELAIDKVETLPGEKLELVGENLGTDLVLLGSYLAIGESGGGKVRLVVHVQDTRKGETVQTFTSNGSEADLFGLIEEASSGLRTFLSLRSVTAAERGAVRAAFPEDPEASRLYALGLEKLRASDLIGARRDLERAVALEPDHPLPRSYLAEVLYQIGFEADARSLAEQALAAADGLPERQREEVEARSYFTTADWEREAETYRRMLKRAPGDLDAALKLASALGRAGRSAEAAEVLDGLRRLDHPTREVARIDLALAMSAGSVSDLEGQLEAADRAIAGARRTGATLIAAAALAERSQALFALGRLDESYAAAGESIDLFTAAGDRGSVAESLVTQANVLQRKGELEAARQKYEQALAIRRAVGNRRGAAACLNNLASILSAQGDRTGAVALYEDSLALKEEIGDLQGVVTSETPRGASGAIQTTV